MEYPDRIVEFAFCPRPCYQYLADLAGPEEWGEENRVLVNYIDFTYRRAAELMRREGAPGSFIVTDGESACFDTGLFTSRFEEIYALFERNTRDGAQPWFLKGFFKASDTALAGVDVLPERVHYAENPADLVYDFHLAVRRPHPGRREQPASRARGAARPRELAPAAARLRGGHRGSRAQGRGKLHDCRAAVLQRSHPAVVAAVPYG